MIEYNGYFEPMLFIFITLLSGFIIGSLTTMYFAQRDMRDMTRELDAKNRALDTHIKALDNKYIDDGYEAY